MPLLQVSLFEGRTTDQKRAFAKEVVDVAVRTLKCNPDAVDVIFIDVKKSDWAEGGTLMSDEPG